MKITTGFIAHISLLIVGINIICWFDRSWTEGQQLAYGMLGILTMVSLGVFILVNLWDE